jgi:uncharacterized protein
MIVQKLQALIPESMKAGDFLRTETLRMLSSALNYERIALQHELTQEEELNVIRKQVKQRRDSIDAYTKAGAFERAKKEEDEMKILQEFLPPELSDAEMAKLIDDAIAQVGPKNMADMGKVIGLVKSRSPNADGGRIAAIVKNKLSQ